MKNYSLTENQTRLFWSKVDKSETCWNWTRSVSVHGGYGQVWIENAGESKVVYMAHRLSFFMAYGYAPDEVDHECGNRKCVRPDHLRAVTRKQNNENRRGANANSKSGIRGVVWNSQRSKWKATATHNRKEYHGGFFASIDAAEEAVVELRNRLFTHNSVDRLIP